MFFYLRFLRIIEHLSIFLVIQCILTFSPSYGQSGIRVNLDVAQFQGADKVSYLEIYYSIPEVRTLYTPDDQNQFSCQLVMDLQIFKDRSLWASKLWKIEKSVKDTTDRNQQSHLVDIIRYQVAEATSYRVVIHAKDMNQPNHIDSASTEIMVREFSDTGLEISDMELASSIKRIPKDTQSVFLKNVYEVTPNPGGLYGVSTPVVYYYFEAYNLMDNVPGAKYKTLCQVKDSDNRIVKGLGNSYRTKKKAHDSSVEMGVVNIAKLPSGKYTLVYGITDSSENVFLNKEKPFFVYNPAVARADLVTEPSKEKGDSSALEMSVEEELDEEFEWMGYITTKEERQIYDNLSNANAKRNLILSVWQSPRAASDGAAGPAFREGYLTRVRQAETMFTSVFRQGWKSDRGRVYILYGGPSHVDRFPSTETTVPYEIWNYDYLRGQAGVIFVFSDQAGFNKYQLLHSSLRGELMEPNWQRLINRGTTDPSVFP